MKNFPFEKDGRTFWYSRSIVCLSAIFCEDSDDIFILANKRGTATPKEVGKWNLPVGFLDFDETCQQCAAREVFEETGLRIKPYELSLYNVNSKPDDGNQDVSFRYHLKLAGQIADFPLSTAHQEKNEVVAARWINIKELNDYEWAWNHLSIIVEIGTHLFGAPIINKSIRR